MHAARATPSGGSTSSFGVARDYTDIATMLRGLADELCLTDVHQPGMPAVAEVHHGPWEDPLQQPVERTVGSDRG